MPAPLLGVRRLAHPSDGGSSRALVHAFSRGMPNSLCTTLTGALNGVHFLRRLYCFDFHDQLGTGDLHWHPHLQGIT